MATGPDMDTETATDMGTITVGPPVTAFRAVVMVTATRSK